MYSPCSRHVWTKSAIATLRVLCNAGVPFPRIAKRLGVSPAAARQKALRLKKAGAVKVSKWVVEPDGSRFRQTI
jgi:DNA-binding Lrp family transcriptional regulator